MKDNEKLFDEKQEESIDPVETGMDLAVVEGQQIKIREPEDLQSAIVLKFKDSKEKLDKLVAEADDFVVDSMDALRDAKKMSDERKDFAKNHTVEFKTIKDRINAFKQVVLDEEKLYINVAKESQKVILDKADEYQDKVEKEAREQAQIEAAKQRVEDERKLKAQQKKMEKAMAAGSDLDAQISNLHEMLEDHSVDFDEAERIRAKITVLEAQREKKNEAIEAAAAKAEELAAPAPASTPPPPPAASIAGLSRKVEVTISVMNPNALVRAIADEKIPITAIKEWDMTVLKNLEKAGMALPGCKVDKKMKSNTRT